MGEIPEINERLLKLSQKLDNYNIWKIADKLEKIASIRRDSDWGLIKNKSKWARMRNLLGVAYSMAVVSQEENIDPKLKEKAHNLLQSYIPSLKKAAPALLSFPECREQLNFISNLPGFQFISGYDPSINDKQLKLDFENPPE